MHTAMYSAPAGSGLLYWTHSPALTMIACPAATSNAESFSLTCRQPRRTTVYSSNSGVCPGSSQPHGLFMRAMLTAAVPELTQADEFLDGFGWLARRFDDRWFLDEGCQVRFLQDDEVHADHPTDSPVAVKSFRQSLCRAFLSPLRLLISSFFPLPLEIALQLGMGQQFLSGVVVTPQLLLVGDQGVDGRVTRLADLHALLHFLPGVTSLEPLVRMQRPGNKMVKVVGFLALAKLAEHRFSPMNPDAAISQGKKKNRITTSLAKAMPQ